MLTPADREDLIRRLDFLSDEIADFHLYQSLTWEDYKDRRKRREVERWIENIINVLIDIAKILLSTKAMEIPQTYREILRNISLTNLFRKELGLEISEWASIRNKLAHEYIDIRWDAIKKFIKESQPLLAEFTSGVKNYLLNPQS
ncbi:MAG: type VII toxin-antitoxin system HepT family RNase toxin [Candidatus Brocadia sp.]